MNTDLLSADFDPYHTPAPTGIAATEVESHRETGAEMRGRLGKALEKIWDHNPTESKGELSPSTLSPKHKLTSSG